MTGITYRQERTAAANSSKAERAGLHQINEGIILRGTEWTLGE